MARRSCCRAACSCTVRRSSARHASSRRSPQRRTAARHCWASRRIGQLGCSIRGVALAATDVERLRQGSLTGVCPWAGQPPAAPARLAWRVRGRGLPGGSQPAGAKARKERKKEYALGRGLRKPAGLGQDQAKRKGGSDASLGRLLGQRGPAEARGHPPGDCTTAVQSAGARPAGSRQGGGGAPPASGGTHDLPAWGGSTAAGTAGSFCILPGWLL